MESNPEYFSKMDPDRQLNKYDLDVEDSDDYQEVRKRLPGQNKEE